MNAKVFITILTVILTVGIGIAFADDADGIVLHLYHWQLSKHIKNTAEVGKIRSGLKSLLAEISCKGCRLPTGSSFSDAASGR